MSASKTWKFKLSDIYGTIFHWIHESTLEYVMVGSKIAQKNGFLLWKLWFSSSVSENVYNTYAQQHVVLNIVSPSNEDDTLFSKFDLGSPGNFDFDHLKSLKTCE